MKKTNLIVDGTNLAFMAYYKIDKFNSEGQHIGMVSGFFDRLCNILSFTKPNRVFVCWEGKGSREYRKKLLPEYKGHRTFRPPYFLQDSGFSEKELKENQMWQLNEVKKVLEFTPIKSVAVEGLEADDCVAMLCERYENDKNIIASSDSDFYQLLKGGTVQFNLRKNQLISESDVVELEGVSRVNYLLAKSICGDSSDNIKGMHRVGFKSLAKRFPSFKAGVELNLGDLLEICEEKNKAKKVLKIYEQLPQSVEIIERNLQVVSLQGVSEKRQEEYKKLLDIISGSGRLQLKRFTEYLARLEVDLSQYSNINTQLYMIDRR